MYYSVLYHLTLRHCNHFLLRLLRKPPRCFLSYSFQSIYLRYTRFWFSDFSCSVHPVMVPEPFTVLRLPFRDLPMSTSFRMDWSLPASRSCHSGKHCRTRVQFPFRTWDIQSIRHDSWRMHCILLQLARYIRSVDVVNRLIVSSFCRLSKRSRLTSVWGCSIGISAVLSSRPLYLL